MIKAGVVGWPIEQSKSPIIHNYWLKKYSINGSYEKISCEPKDFSNCIKKLIELDYAGVNITVPFKEKALEISNTVTDCAHKIGAANTLIFKDGKILADNTDAIGFISNLRTQAPEWSADKGTALILGAGGASRSVIFSLLNEDTPKIILTNRTRERAENLAVKFGKKITVIDWSDISLYLSDVKTIVNTTSLGMLGHSELKLDTINLNSETLVTDIVYNPLRTVLLEDAYKKGCTTVDGLGMLLYQAVPGFKKWFGIEPKVTKALRTEVLLAL